MDRNIFSAAVAVVFSTVATREGGVDRNLEAIAELIEAKVATREGGVDRNNPT